MITKDKAIKIVNSNRVNVEYLTKLKGYNWGWIIYTEPINDVSILYGHTYMYMVHKTGYFRNVGKVLWDAKLGHDCSDKELIDAFLKEVNKG